MDDLSRMKRAFCQEIDRRGESVGWSNTELLLQLLADDCREMARRNDEDARDIDPDLTRPACLQPEVDEDA